MKNLNWKRFGGTGILTALLFTGSVFAEAREGKLVTVTGSLKPELSVEVSKEELRKIAEEWSSLRNLPPVKIDINDLFSSGDEEAIKMAANHIAEKFTHAARMIVGLKAIVYRLDALSGIYGSGDDLKSLKRAYSEKFQLKYQTLLSSFALVQKPMIEAFKLCRSEICIKRLADAERSFFQFGQALNDGDTFKVQNSELFVAAVEENFQRMQSVVGQSEKVIEDGEMATEAMVAGLVGSVRGMISSQKLLAQTLGSEESLNRLGLNIPSLPSAVFEAEEGWLKEMVNNRLRAVVLGEKEEIPSKEALKSQEGYRVYLINCWNKYIDDDDSSYHFLVYGRAGKGMHCNDVRTDSDPVDNIRINTYGVGLQFNGLNAFSIIIISPLSIPLEGTWYGVGGGVSVLVGADAAFLLGRGGSTMTVLGMNGFSLGARAGVTTVKIWKDKRR